MQILMSNLALIPGQLRFKCILNYSDYINFICFIFLIGSDGINSNVVMSFTSLTLCHEKKIKLSCYFVY